MNLIEQTQQKQRERADRIAKCYKNSVVDLSSEDISPADLEKQLSDNLSKGIITSDQIEKAYSEFDAIFKGVKYSDTEYNKSKDRVGKSVGEDSSDEEEEKEE